MQRQIPSVKALQSFEAAARTENFSQAANLMNMSQSALSRQISVLETQLQRPLFLRARQRVRLTDAGRQLLNELSPCLNQLETILFRVSVQAERRGALNVGVYPTLGARWLNRILVEASATDPRTTFNTITYLSNDEIDPGLVDLAIAQGDPPFAGFENTPLMAENLVAVASSDLMPEMAEMPRELLQHRILQHATRAETWPIWFESAGVELELAPTGPMFSQFEMLIDAVIRGLGVAIVPEILVSEDIKARRLALAHPHVATPPSGYHLLIPTAKKEDAKINRLCRHLIHCARHS